ncbi:MAG: helix-turn-helix domain-containing protein [Acidovorax sp.]
MARPQSISEEEMSLRLLRTFRRKGYDATSIADLAKDTGLAKAGLYHRFPGGKREMAESVMDDLKHWMSMRVLEPLHAPGEVRAQLEQMVEMLKQLYGNGESPCLIGLFSMGEGLELFQQRLEGALLALQKAIAVALVRGGVPADEASQRAEDAVIRVQGALVLARAQNDPGPFLRTMERLADDLLRGYE